MNIKCVAIDDEPIALQIIQAFCKRRGDIELSCFTEPDKGVEHIETSNPHIVFLDIEMKDSNGLDIASRLPEGTAVIFTTAFMQYALEGFNLDAVDFLHKPFSYERFNNSIEKAIRRLKSSDSFSGKNQILVKQDYNNVPVCLDRILYVEAMENYTKIYMLGGKMILAHNSLKKLSELLPENSFIRIHKSYVVPKAAIKSFSRQNVTLYNDIVLPVGRVYAARLLASFS